MLLRAASPAQDMAVDEGTLFADTSSIADSVSVSRPPTPGEPGPDAKSVGFSGGLLSLIQGGATRDYLERPDAAESRLDPAVVGNLAVDVRLQRGFKAYMDMETAYLPRLAGRSSDSATQWRIPEAFLDANIAHRAYFRVGKQVLQWGRCYFFNPTDLVNVERKTFFRRIGEREGVFGAKAHIPFGTAWNLYGFIDAQGVGRPDSVAGAFRVERLWGGTEASAMIWDRGGGTPVYGADLSTRVLGMDLNAEAALFPEFTRRTLAFESGIPGLRSDEETWSPRVGLGLGRSFRISGIRDRLMTVAEYYYNGTGTADRRMGLSSLLPFFEGGPPPGAATDALAASGLYEPNSYSRNYAAFFATFSRFPRSDMTLTFNAIANLDQACGLVSTGIAYRDLNDFGLSMAVNGFVGPEDTEYTLSGEAVQIRVIAEAGF
jgi:hypothetical protein